MTPLLGQIFAVITAACWAQNSLIYAYTGSVIGSRSVTHIRLWAALPMMVILHLIFTGAVIPSGLAARTYLAFAVSGAVGFGLADLFIFQAFVDIGPRETMVLMTTSPIFSALLSRVMNNDRLQGIETLGMAVTLLGVAMVVLYDRRKANDSRSTGVHHLRGVVFGLSGALAQAVGVALSKGGLAYEPVHPVSANLIRLTAGLLALMLYAAIRREFSNDFRKMLNPSNRKTVLLIAFAALVGPVGGIILNLYALSVVSAGVVAALTQVTPIMLLPYERFVQKKHIRSGAVAGTITAIGGVFLLFLA